MKASLWKCLACGVEFVWHPGVSKLKRPSMCPECDQDSPAILVPNRVLDIEIVALVRTKDGDFKPAALSFRIENAVWSPMETGDEIVGICPRTILEMGVRGSDGSIEQLMHKPKKNEPFLRVTKK